MPTPSDRPARPAGPAPTATGPTATATAPAHRAVLDTVIAWTGWHLPELTGTGVPTLLALTVSPWWALPAVLVAGVWVTHEIRLARRHRLALTTRSAPNSAPAAPARGPAHETEVSAS